MPNPKGIDEELFWEGVKDLFEDKDIDDIEFKETALILKRILIQSIRGERYVTEEEYQKSFEQYPKKIYPKKI